MLLRLNIFFIIFVLNTQLMNSVKFLDVDHLMNLVSSESDLISKVQDYIAKEQQKLDNLKMKMLKFQKNNAKAIGEITTSFLNPINVFSFTKRLAVDWDEVEENICSQKFLGQMQFFRKVNTFPDKNNLSDAAFAFIRLQLIYKLAPKDIVEGKLNDVQYNSSLTANDCFRLGVEAYQLKQYYFAIGWLNQTLSMEVDKKTRTESLKLVSSSYYELGQLKFALEATTELLEITPDDAIEQRNKDIFEELNANPTTCNAELFQYRNKFGHKFNDDVLYAKLCRGDLEQSPRKVRTLHCRYMNTDSAFLKIAPLKQEVLSLDPFIAIFHDVIYDKEIKIMKELSTPGNLRGSTFREKDDRTELVRFNKNVRIQKVYGDQFLSRLYKRVSDITSFDEIFFENLQINKYETGGYYTTHYDFFHGMERVSKNRIMTVLFYANDVGQGGATIFPFLNITVWPKKGSAVMWYNLLPSRKVDRKTMHSGCPILFGSKLIPTYWIEEKANFTFVGSRSLKYQEVNVYLNHIRSKYAFYF